MDTGRIPADEMIERCITAIQTQGYAVEDCLALFPTERTELEPLLRLALRLNKARSLEPSPAFKAAAQNRLKNLAAPRRKPHYQAGLPRLRFSLLWAGLLIAVLIASSVGTAVVSASALPGDFLYPVKRAQEGLQMTLTMDEAQRANLHLAYANRRIDEAVTLVNQNRTQSIDQAVSDYGEQFQAELAFLEQGSRLSADEKAVLAEKLLADIIRHEASLNYLGEAAPASQANIASARAVSQRVYRRADQIMKGQGGEKPPAPSLPAVTSTPVRPPKPSPTSTPSPQSPFTSTAAGPQSGPGIVRPSPTPGISSRTPTHLPSPATGSIPKSPTRLPSPTPDISSYPGPNPTNSLIRTRPPTLPANPGSIATRKATQTALSTPNLNVGKTPTPSSNTRPTPMPNGSFTAGQGIPTFTSTITP